MKIGTTTITTTTTFATTSAWWLLLLLLGPLGGGINSNHRSNSRSFAVATFNVCQVDDLPQDNDKVICTDDEKCIQNEITNCESVVCEGTQVCNDARIENVSSVVCHGFHACPLSTIENVGTVVCEGRYACDQVTINNVGSVVCNGGDACRGWLDFQPFLITGDPSTTCLRCQGRGSCGEQCYFPNPSAGDPEFVECKSLDPMEFGNCGVGVRARTSAPSSAPSPAPSEVKLSTRGRGENRKRRN